MTRLCEYCGQTALETDTICWHCGRQLPPPARPAVPAPAEPATSTDSRPRRDVSRSWTNVALYGGLTVAVLVAMLLLMRSLGQQPVAAIMPTVVPGEWITLMDARRQMALEIPEGWSWRWFSQIEALPLDERVALREQMNADLAPWSHLAPDIEPMLAAGQDEAMIVVARSAVLNAPQPDQILASLQSESFATLVITEATLGITSARPTTDSLLITLEHRQPLRTCRQLFAPGKEFTYLVAACSPPDAAAQNRNVFTAALDSFRIVGD